MTIGPLHTAAWSFGSKNPIDCIFTLKFSTGTITFAPSFVVVVFIVASFHIHQQRYRGPEHVRIEQGHFLPQFRRRDRQVRCRRRLPHPRLSRTRRRRSFCTLPKLAGAAASRRTFLTTILSQRFLVSSSSSSSSLKNATTTTSKMLLLLATIFFQKRRLFRRLGRQQQRRQHVFTTCLLCGLFLSNSRFFSLSIRILDSKKKRKRNPVSLRVSVVVVVRVFFAARRESSSLYTRFPKSSCFCAHIIEGREEESFATKRSFRNTTRVYFTRIFVRIIQTHAREREETLFFFFESPRKKSIYAHRRSRGVVVRDEAALFGTSILRVFLFALFKRTRERERDLFLLLRISS